MMVYTDSEVRLCLPCAGPPPIQTRIQRGSGNSSQGSESGARARAAAWSCPAGSAGVPMIYTIIYTIWYIPYTMLYTMLYTMVYNAATTAAGTANLCKRYNHSESLHHQSVWLL